MLPEHQRALYQAKSKALWDDQRDKRKQALNGLLHDVPQISSDIQLDIQPDIPSGKDLELQEVLGPPPPPASESKIFEYDGMRVELVQLLNEGTYGRVFAAIEQATQQWFAVKIAKKTATSQIQKAVQKAIHTSRDDNHNKIRQQVAKRKKCRDNDGIPARNQNSYQNDGSPSTDCADDSIYEVAKEYQFLRRLRHPHVIGCYGIMFNDTQVALLLDLAVESLQSWIDAHPLPLQPAPTEILNRRHMSAQIIMGLTFVHSRRILHCDLKPGNIICCLACAGGADGRCQNDGSDLGGESAAESAIFIEEDEHNNYCGWRATSNRTRLIKLKLADFGLSVMLPSNRNLGNRQQSRQYGVLVPGNSVYSANYRPPECWVAGKQPTTIHFHSDVWALGCVLFEVMAAAGGGAKGIAKATRRQHLIDDPLKFFFPENTSTSSKTRIGQQALNDKFQREMAHDLAASIIIRGCNLMDVEIRFALKKISLHFLELSSTLESHGNQAEKAT